MIYKKSWKYILCKDKLYGGFYYRIKSLKTFGKVQKGELGGLVQGYYNLSQKGNCWICDKALAIDNAKVTENAWIFNEARVYHHARIGGDAIIGGSKIVFGSKIITEGFFTE